MNWFITYCYRWCENYFLLAIMSIKGSWVKIRSTFRKRYIQNMQKTNIRIPDHVWLNVFMLKSTSVSLIYSGELLHRITCQIKRVKPHLLDLSTSLIAFWLTWHDILPFFNARWRIYFDFVMDTNCLLLLGGILLMPFALKRCPFSWHFG